MRKTHHLIALAAVAAVATFTLPAARAQVVPEAAKTAINATEKGLKKAEDAVVHAVKVANENVQFGLGKAGEAVDHTARRLGLPGSSTPAPAPSPRSMADAKR